LLTVTTSSLDQSGVCASQLHTWLLPAELLVQALVSAHLQKWSFVLFPWTRFCSSPENNYKINECAAMEEYQAYSGKKKQTFVINPMGNINTPILEYS
jgi:hypothetical protein